MATATQTEASNTTRVGGRHGQVAVERTLPPAQAHQAVIAGVRAEKYASGTTALIIGYQSQNTGATFEQKLFLSDEFAANPGIDPSELSDEKEFNDETGKEKASPRQKYAMSIANTSETKFQGQKVVGDAPLQILSRIAESQGKVDDPKDQAGEAYADIEDFAARYNTLLSGVQAVILCAPQKTGEFRGRLELRRVYEPNEAITLYDQGKLFKAGGKTPTVVMWNV